MEERLRIIALNMKRNGIITDRMKVAIDKLDDSALEMAERELSICEKHGIRVLLRSDNEFPPLLNYIEQCPDLLYVAGDTSVFSKTGIAIIGARLCSERGRRNTEDVVNFLSGYDVVLVSGLARGIDSHAHSAGCSTSMQCAAVLGSGLLRLYPPEKKWLYDKIIDNGGVVLSEFPLDTPPRRWHFPRRNRVISGLSKGVIVIEAREKSGTMITVRYALAQGREVMALPGDLASELSEGTNWLCKEGAVIITHPSDITGEISLPEKNIPKCLVNRDFKRLTLDSLEREIISLINDKPIFLSDIVCSLGGDPVWILGRLNILIKAGVVNLLKSGKYSLLGSKNGKISINCGIPGKSKDNRALSR